MLICNVGETRARCCPDRSKLSMEVHSTSAMLIRLPCCSSKREPLGQSYLRGHQLPQGMGVDRPFGMTIDAKVRRSGIGNRPWHGTSNIPMSHTPTLYALSDLLARYDTNGT